MRPLFPDQTFDPLAHINCRLPSFYTDAAAAAEFMLHGENDALIKSARSVLVAAIMNAALNSPTVTLTDVQKLLTEASQRIRSRTIELSKGES